MRESHTDAMDSLSTAVPPSERSLFIRMTVLRPVTILVLILALLVMGFLSYPRIPLQLIPDGLNHPGCFIWIPVPDATPREVMERIAKPCEDHLRRIPGIRSVISTASATKCRIRIEFSAEEDPLVMIAEIRDRMERARAEWIDGVDRYFLWRQSESAMPIYVCAISMNVDEDEVDVDYIVDEVITKRLTAVDGVARVNTWGLLTKYLEIGLDPDKVDAYGVNLYNLIQQLSADNQTINAGSVWQGDKELLVRFDGRFRDFDEIREFPSDRLFRVRDFANVDYNYSVKDQLSRANGFRSRTIVVHKESAANAVDVCERVEKKLHEIGEDLKLSVPGLTNFETHTWFNQGEMIRYSVTSLTESAMWGGLFAVVVLFAFFRRLGMTLLVTLAIPFSLLITVIWIFFRGGSFNLISLLGMSLGIGMLVDNSIVVVENIVRKRESGLSPQNAAIAGVSEVGLAVTLATLTTVMVFLPILFIGDPRFKVITTEIGEPVCISVLASLLVALAFIPQGASYVSRWREMADRGSRIADWKRALAVGVRRLPILRRWIPSAALAVATVPAAQPSSSANPSFSRINELSAGITSWCLRYRVETFLVVVALTVVTALAYESLPKVTEPDDGPQGLEVHVRLPKNFSLAEANDRFARIEASVLKHKDELRLSSVTSWFHASGGELNLFLETGERVEEDEFFERLRPLLPQLAGVNYRFGREDFARDQGEARIRVFVQGNDIEQLEELAARVRDQLDDRKRFPELRDVTQWRDDERDEIRIQVARRQAQRYDVDTATVSRMVSWALRGAPLPDFVREDREYPFWIRYGASVKDDASEIDAIRVFREDGEFVRLENLASYTVTPGLGEIHRVNGKMTIGYSAHVEGSMERARDRLDRFCKRFPGVPEGFELSLTQGLPGYEADFTNAAAAMIMAFLLVFFLMGILFESFILPISVLCVVPFALFGSIGLLWAMGLDFEVVGMIGMLILVGIVVNNAIVLVDQVNRLRKAGLEKNAALLAAVKIRFRPVWMTALTTIFGLLPLMLFPQQGDGVDYKPIAVVLAGGLATSTFFTLFMVPLFYSLLDDLRLTSRDMVAAVAHGVSWRGSGASSVKEQEL